MFGWAGRERRGNHDLSSKKGYEGCLDCEWKEEVPLTTLMLLKCLGGFSFLSLGWRVLMTGDDSWSWELRRLLSGLLMPLRGWSSLKYHNGEGHGLGLAGDWMPAILRECGHSVNRPGGHKEMVM